MRFINIFHCILFLCPTFVWGNDSLNTRPSLWSFHFQQTIIEQYKPAIHASYTGSNSVSTGSENRTSLTATFFAGYRLSKNLSVYINPEIAGGAGISRTLGIAGFPNGETYRVGAPEPKLFLARAYFRYIISLSKKRNELADDKNQVAGTIPASYFSLTGGKFCIADFFDNNKYSHDPRTQFMNWSLMSSGAWDYPANTRGYTAGIIAEYIHPQWEIRFSSALVPLLANGPDLNFDIKKASSESIEIQRKFSHDKISLIGFHTRANMGNYIAATQRTDTVDIVGTRKDGRLKLGIGVNYEHTFNSFLGLFSRLSWNDGKNETWAFTEIDRHFSLGFVVSGHFWRRENDHIGIAFAANGISKEHEDYLRAGGYGFIIGDGKINYGAEKIMEFYYSFRIPSWNLSLSPDMQYIMNPAYNKDRGPVNTYGIRAHIEF